jgi:hypothetical protein
MNNTPQRSKRSYLLPIVIIICIGVCSYYSLWPIIASRGLFTLLIRFLLLGAIILSFILTINRNTAVHGRLPLRLSVLMLVMIVLIEITNLPRRWEWWVHSPQYAPIIEQQKPETTHMLFVRDQGFEIWSVSGFLYSRDNTVPATCGEDSSYILDSSRPISRSWFWVTGQVNEGFHGPPTRCVIFF